MQGKANCFQQSMLQWNDMHPYNAVHVVKIPALLDEGKLEPLINTFLQKKGLTNLILNQKHNTYHYSKNSKPVEITSLEKTNNEPAALNCEIQKQINTPFETAPEITPFRFFTLPGETYFHLGLVYFHFISDAHFIIALLKELTCEYLEIPNPNKNPNTNYYPKTYKKLLPKKISCLSRWCRNLPTYISKLRSSHRISHQNIQNLKNNYTSFSLTETQFRLLKNTSKKWGVTLNDLFFALLFSAMSPHTKQRHHSLKRRNLSISSIANIRKDLSVPLETTLGVFLSFFYVSHPVPQGISLQKLAQDIHRQTTPIKEKKAYLYSIFNLLISLKIHKRLKPNQKRKFYQKSYPMCCGITNMNVDTHWKQLPSQQCLDYLRGVSTGPIVPLVFSLTTIDNHLNLGISYRQTAFAEKEIESIICSFRQSVADLEKSKRENEDEEEM